jgi:CHASE3 domain sensor protein
MKISAKLIVAFGCVVAIMLVVGGLLFCSMSDVVRLQNLSEDLAGARYDGSQINLIQARQKAESRGYIVKAQTVSIGRYQNTPKSSRPSPPT